MCRELSQDDLIQLMPDVRGSWLILDDKSSETVDSQ